jgi:LPXTG-motif cell wall-anchored protein
VPAPVYGAEGDFTAANGLTYDIYYTAPGAGTATLTGPVDYAGALNIPATITVDNDNGFDGTYPVTAIGDDAFFNYTNPGITSLTIPSSVTSIGNWAFRYQYYLSGSLTIPDSVTHIGNLAFGEVGTELEVGSNGSLTLPNSLTDIGADAFIQMYFTGPLNIPGDMTTIPVNSFCGVTFTGPLVIPNGVETIEASAFQRATFAGSLVIPSTVNTIGDDAFNSSNFSEKTLVIPNSVTTIGSTAFLEANFTTLDISDINASLVVENSAFNMEGLKTIYLGTVIPADGSENMFLGYKASSLVPNEGTLYYPEGMESLAEEFNENFLKPIGSTGWLEILSVPLEFADSPSYDIPAATVGDEATDIDVSGGVSGGISPYTFSAEGLPAGVSISPSGVISATHTVEVAAGTATITVADSEAKEASIEIGYGAVTKDTGGGAPPDHHIIFNSHDKNFVGGKDGLTAFDETVVVKFKGDLKSVTEFKFNNDNNLNFTLSPYVGDNTPREITEVGGGVIGSITRGDMEAESLSLLADNESVVVTLPAEFTNRLENGTYEIEVWFSDSRVKAEAGVADIVVHRPAADPVPQLIPEDTPKTGDEANLNFLLTLGGLSLAALLGLIAYRRRQTQLS